MKGRLFTVLILVLFLVPSIAFGDPVMGGWLRIEGAHIVSTGAYFRFWLENHYEYTINVTINDADTFRLSPGDSINYNVIAPQITMPYEIVGYTFKVRAQNISEQTYSADVIVLNSGFVQLFDAIVPILIILATALIALVLVLFLKRRA